MSRYRDVVLFFLLGIFWGTSFVAVEIGLRAFSPILLVALRFDIAAVLLLGYAAVAIEDWIPRTREDWTAVLASGVLIIAINNSLLFYGQQYTTGGIAAIVYSLNPILTTVFVALLIGGSGLSLGGYTGVLLGLFGVGLVANPDPSNLAGSETLFGVSLVFVGAVFVSLGSVLVRRAESTCSPVAIAAWSMLVGAVLSHGFSAALGEPLVFPLSKPLVVAAVIYMATLSTAVAYHLYFTLLDRLGPFEINLVSYVVPTVATIAGWALLGERVTVFTVSGFCCVFLGFLLLKRRVIADELGHVRRLFPLLRK